WYNGSLNGVHEHFLARLPTQRGVLHLGAADSGTAAGAHVPADRLRAELPVPATGVLPRPRRQRRTDSPPGASVEPSQLYLHRPSRPGTDGAAPQRPSWLYLGPRCSVG